MLYSENSDLYYTGYSQHPIRRVFEHNSKNFDTFTSKHRPWILKTYFKCSTNESEVIKIERFIKKQKSRQLIEKLCDCNFIPSGSLAQLVRVPDVRD